MPDSPLNAIRLAAAIVALVTATSCLQGGRREADSAQALVAASPWPTPLLLPPDAPPHILALWMNETSIQPGRIWAGRIVTSTNVASVEVRTESFSFAADRHAFGVFTFSQTVLDVIPQYRRAYTLEVIARNTRGDSDKRFVPIVIR
ncbi:MAG: hypothetical protein WAK11_12590 [Candidatus Cybelea sp.]